MRNICFTGTSHQLCWTFFSCWRWNLVLLCQFTVVHFALISNIFLCRYACRTLRMKLLTWCRVISRVGLFGSGSGLSFSKYFGPISSLHTRRFYNIKRNDFFREVDLCAHRSNFCEWSDCDFLQIILFANTVAFFYSLLRLVSHPFWEGDSGEEISTWWRCDEEINHSRDSWLVLRSLQAGFSCL